jgi:hypothetical protein
VNERRIHQIFEINILLKGFHALIECIDGLAPPKGIPSPWVAAYRIGGHVRASSLALSQDGAYSTASQSR